ncbi:MAG: ATP-binding protein [Syntrophobacter sp.]
MRKIVSLPGAAEASGVHPAKRSEEFVPAVFEPQWVPTSNERNLQVVMDQVAKAPGRRRFISVTGEAGRGKTLTTLREAGQAKAVHMLMLEIWRSPLPFLQALCREHGVEHPPRRTNDCWLLLIDRLISRSKPVYLDEMDMTPHLLNVVRQLAEITAVPFVLVGEEALIAQLASVKRCWSGTYQALQFESVALSDVIFYAKQSGGLELLPESAGLIHGSPCGRDWRDLERVTHTLVEIANSKRSRTITEAMAEQALRMSLKGEDGVRSRKGVGR